MITSRTEAPGGFPQRIYVREHVVRADVGAELGSVDSAPGPHDLFDAALVACKALTAKWFAKKNGFPLEGVDVSVERDDTEERKGVYVLKVKVAFHGPLDDAQRARLHDVVSRCPVHKLMTTTDVRIETLPPD